MIYSSMNSFLRTPHICFFNWIFKNSFPFLYLELSFEQSVEHILLVTILYANQHYASLARPLRYILETYNLQNLLKQHLFSKNKIN